MATAIKVIKANDAFITPCLYFACVVLTEEVICNSAVCLYRLLRVWPVCRVSFEVMHAQD